MPFPARTGVQKYPFVLFDIHSKTVPVPLKEPYLVETLIKKHKDILVLGLKPNLLRTRPESELMPKRISVGSLYINYLNELDRATSKKLFDRINIYLSEKLNTYTRWIIDFDDRIFLKTNMWGHQ